MNPQDTSTNVLQHDYNYFAFHEQFKLQFILNIITLATRVE